MCFAFHHLVHPSLAVGNVEVFVVSEAFFAQGHTAATDQGGMAYSVVRRHAVNCGATQGIGNYGQVVRFVVQPLTLLKSVILVNERSQRRCNVKYDVFIGMVFRPELKTTGVPRGGDKFKRAGFINAVVIRFAKLRRADTGHE